MSPDKYIPELLACAAKSPCSRDKRGAMTFRVRCRATGDVGDIHLVVDPRRPDHPWEAGVLQKWLWQHPDYDDARLTEDVTP